MTLFTFQNSKALNHDEIHLSNLEFHHCHRLYLWKKKSANKYNTKESSNDKNSDKNEMMTKMRTNSAGYGMISKLGVGE